MLMLETERLTSRFMALEQVEPTLFCGRRTTYAQKSSALKFIQCEFECRLNANEMFIRGC